MRCYTCCILRDAPGTLVFVRGDILAFDEIASAWVRRRAQVTYLNNDPVRHVVVHMSAVIVWRGLRVSPREKACKRIDPRAGTQTVARPAGIQTGTVRSEHPEPR